MNVDFGCGSKKREGYLGVDAIAFDGVDIVADLAKEKWPFDDDAVMAGHSSHFLEHLDTTERIHFFNELYRVMAPNAMCAILTPHWKSEKAYGDPTHKWPPVCMMSYAYLNREWREKFAPHCSFYLCNFLCNGRETEDEVIVLLVKK